MARCGPAHPGEEMALLVPWRLRVPPHTVSLGILCEAEALMLSHVPTSLQSPESLLLTISVWMSYTSFKANHSKEPLFPLCLFLCAGVPLASEVSCMGGTRPWVGVSDLLGWLTVLPGGSGPLVLAEVPSAGKDPGWP